jgi:5-formyltetrahydrofolate cyclo-ligase
VQEPDVDSAIRQQKQALRQRLREQRANFASSADPAVAAAAGRDVAAHVEKTLRFPPGGCVAVYAPLRGELDPSPIADLARRHGSRVCYPRIVDAAADTPSGRDGRALAFHVVNADDELSPQRYGIPEPSAKAPLAPAIDIFFVPGLGFDPKGQRLGMGLGYYDAALRAQPFALRVGVGHEWQLVPRVPCEAHDELLDLVVTPRGCVQARGRGEPAALRLRQSPMNKEEPT